MLMSFALVTVKGNETKKRNGKEKNEEANPCLCSFEFLTECLMIIFALWAIYIVLGASLPS